MTYIKYQHFNLRLKSEALIERINWIIAEYQADDFTPRRALATKRWPA